MRHKGKDRRVHTCFITNNREYHVRAGECMAVRDRRTGVWIAGHAAVGMRLREQAAGSPFLGRRLEFFCIEKEQIIRTSPVIDINRPGRTEVQSYRLVHGFVPDEDLAV